MPRASSTGFAAAGRIGARVQRSLDEGVVGGADGVVQRLPAIAVAGFRVCTRLEQRRRHLPDGVVPGGVVERRAAAGVAAIGVRAARDQIIYFGAVLGHRGGYMDELRPVAQPETPVHAISVNHTGFLIGRVRDRAELHRFLTRMSQSRVQIGV